MRAEAVIRARQEEKVDQLRSRRKEKEEIFTVNKSNLQSEEEFKRVENLKSINIKTRKVKYIFFFYNDHNFFFFYEGRKT